MANLKVVNLSLSENTTVRIYRLHGTVTDTFPISFTPMDIHGASHSITLSPRPAGWGFNFGNNYGAPLNV